MGLLNLLFRQKGSLVQRFLKRDALLLDVRTQKEWDAEHIENSMHIPIKDLKDHLEELKQHHKSIIVYCKSGVRSEKAKILLKSQGIKVVNGGGLVDVKKYLNT